MSSSCTGTTREGKYYYYYYCVEKSQQLWQLLMNVCTRRLLTVEEKVRMQKEEKLTKADKNIALAVEELGNYR